MASPFTSLSFRFLVSKMGMIRGPASPGGCGDSMSRHMRNAQHTSWSLLLLYNYYYPGLSTRLSRPIQVSSADMQVSQSHVLVKEAPVPHPAWVVREGFPERRERGRKGHRRQRDQYRRPEREPCLPLASLGLCVGERQEMRLLSRQAPRGQFVGGA